MTKMKGKFLECNRKSISYRNYKSIYFLYKFYHLIVRPCDVKQIIHQIDNSIKAKRIKSFNGALMIYAVLFYDTIILLTVMRSGNSVFTKDKFKTSIVSVLPPDFITSASYLTEKHVNRLSRFIEECGEEAKYGAISV